MKTFIQISHLQPLPDGKTCALPSIDNYPFGCVVVQKKLNKCKRPSQIHHHRRDGIGFFSPSPRPGHEVPSEIHASMSAIYRSHWQRMFCPALSWSQATSLFSSDHELGLMRQMPMSTTERGVCPLLGSAGFSQGCACSAAHAATY